MQLQDQMQSILRLILFDFFTWNKSNGEGRYPYFKKPHS
jgi:hypothetical protein